MIFTKIKHLLDFRAADAGVLEKSADGSFVTRALDWFVSTEVFQAFANIVAASVLSLQQAQAAQATALANHTHSSIINGDISVAVDNDGSIAASPAASQYFNLLRNTSGVDGKLALINEQNEAGAGSAIDFFHNNGSAIFKTVRIEATPWFGSRNFGSFRVRVGNNDNWGASFGVDPNGTFDAPKIVGNSVICASQNNAVGLAQTTGGGAPGTGDLRHGWWSQDHLDMTGRTNGFDWLCLSWNLRFGVGFPSRDMEAKFHVKNNDPAQPVQILQGASGQSEPLQKFQLVSSTAAVRDAGTYDVRWTGSDNTDATRTSEISETTAKLGTMTEVRRSDHLDSTTQTNFMLKYNNTLVRVLVGAADSAGAGYRTLRIAN